MLNSISFLFQKEKTKSTETQLSIHFELLKEISSENNFTSVVLENSHQSEESRIKNPETFGK